MKKIFTLLSAIALTASIISAQDAPPKAFSYKATIKRANGWGMIKKTISLKVSILMGSKDGVAVYTEYFRPTTNEFGQIDVIIGKGKNADLSSVNWGASVYFLKTEVDVKGGDDFELLNIVQLLSVPYSLYSGEAGNGFAKEYSVTENRPVLDKDGNLSLGLPDNPSSKLNVAGNINFTGDLLKNGVPFRTETTITAGTNITVTGTGTVSNPYIISSEGTISSNHYVGELSGGGIVFYVDHTGQHGLIASLRNVSSKWSNVSDEVGTTDNSSWNGLANSNAIIAQTGHVSSAAMYCLDFTEEGFDDWFLPAIDQLNLLYNARYEINKTLASDGNQGTEILWQTSYWSSTEYIVTFMASVLNMQDGTSTCLDKSTQLPVRAIREF
jgi:hypothetical protein